MPEPGLKERLWFTSARPARAALQAWAAYLGGPGPPAASAGPDPGHWDTPQPVPPASLRPAGETRNVTVYAVGLRLWPGSAKLRPRAAAAGY